MSKLQTKGRFFDKYLNYSVITWQLLFVDIDQQLKDYDDIKRDEDKETEAKEMIKQKQIKAEAEEKAVKLS